MGKKKPNSLNKLSKKQLLKRINEVIKRITMPAPDCVLEDGSFETYKQYVLEPFYYANYSELEVK